MLERGDIHTVTEVVRARGGQLIRTDKAGFGILLGPDVTPGDPIEIGSVCGDWCFLFVKGERVRANILSTDSPDDKADAVSDR